MKKLLFTFLFTLVAKILFAQNLSFDKIPNHPRILWLENEEEIIRNEIKKQAIKNNIHLNIIEEANKMLELLPQERIQIGRRLLSVSRECLRRVFYLSYAYRMTKEPKYFKRCEAELLKVSEFSDWNPSHFLDVAEMTMAVSIGYDWLSKELNHNSKQIIKNAIIKKGINPSFDVRYNSWLIRSNNWNQVCNAGMTYGALAIYEDEPALAQKIINRANKSIVLPLKDYSPDGAYPEGYSYWNYGTGFQLLYTSVLQKLNISNEKLDQGLEKTPKYYLHMLGPTGKPFNYADASAIKGGLSPSMFWFAKNFNDPSLLFLEEGFSNQKDMVKNRILPAALIWSMGLASSSTATPKDLMYMGQGKSPVAMMRSSWTDPKALFVGFKAGSPSVSHAHMDVGSFVMDALGERWVMDLGMQDYESLESNGIKLWDKTQTGQRWDILRYNNFHHSTLTFDNQLQNVLGNSILNSQVNKPNFMAAVSDISALYNVGKVQRGVGIIDDKMVVVRDEIETNEKETIMKWHIVTTAKLNVISPKMATLTLNGKTVYLNVQTNQAVEIKSWQPVSKITFDAPNPDVHLVGFEIKIPKNSKQNLTVIMTPNQPFDDKISVPDLKNWKD